MSEQEATARPRRHPHWQHVEFIQGADGKLRWYIPLSAYDWPNIEALRHRREFGISVLRNNRAPLSGSKLAKILGVDRNAIYRDYELGLFGDERVMRRPAHAIARREFRISARAAYQYALKYIAQCESGVPAPTNWGQEVFPDPFSPEPHPGGTPYFDLTLGRQFLLPDAGEWILIYDRAEDRWHNWRRVTAERAAEIRQAIATAFDGNTR